MKPM
jgi:hypothetical protein